MLSWFGEFDRFNRFNQFDQFDQFNQEVQDQEGRIPFADASFLLANKIRRS